MRRMHKDAVSICVSLKDVRYTLTGGGGGATLEGVRASRCVEQLLCQLVDRQTGAKGTLGTADTFPLPPPPLKPPPPTPPAARVMDEGIEHTAGGPTDTWVPLRESASHLVTLFHSLSPNALWAFSKGHFYIGIRCFTSFTLAVFIFDVRSHAKMEKCSDPGRPWNADNCKYQR